MEERNRDVEKAFGNSEKKLIEERTSNDELSQKMEQMERQNKELKREVMFPFFLSNIYTCVCLAIKVSATCLSHARFCDHGIDINDF